MKQAAIVAVDGGNSKTELLLVGRDGRCLAFVRGETISHQQVGWGPGMARLQRLAAAAAEMAGISGSRPVAGHGTFCLAGADSRAENARLVAALHEAGVAGEV